MMGTYRKLDLFRLINAMQVTSTVKPGDTLTVTVIPLRSGKPGCLLVEAKTGDGKALGGNP